MIRHIRYQALRGIVRRGLRPSFKAGCDIERTRRGLDRFGRLTPPPRGSQFEAARIGGRPGIWAAPSAAAMAAPDTLLYFHGGGFVVGSAQSYRAYVARVARASGVRALLPEYRLAPEDPYPAAIDDGEQAYLDCLAQGIPASRIVIGGDSAGGFLTLAVLQRLRERGAPLPAGGVLLSPALEALHFDGESYRTREGLDPWFSIEDMKWFSAQFAGGLEPRPAEFSPLNQSLDGLPPLLVQAGDHEVLLSDATRLAERGQAAGVEVTLQVWPHMWHVFQVFSPLLPQANEALERIGRFTRSRLGESEPAASAS